MHHFGQCPSMPLHWPAAPPSSGSHGPKGQDGGAHFHFILALARELQVAGSSGKAPRPALPRGRSTPLAPQAQIRGTHRLPDAQQHTQNTHRVDMASSMLWGAEPFSESAGGGSGYGGGAQEGKPSSLKRTSSCAHQQEENKCHGLSCQPPTYCSCGFKR